MAIESSQDNTENSVVTPRFTAAFKNTDIREFINIVSKNLHKTIIIDSQVQGEVSVHSYEQLTADQYYQFFLNVLEVYGYTVITNSDNILKVVPSEKGQRAALTAQQKKLNGADIVVRVVPMQNLSGDSLAPILDKFNNNMGVGSVRYYKPGNSLLITGRADEVRALEAIVLDLDKNSSSRTSVDIIPVRNTKPSVIKKAVTDIYSNSADSSADSSTDSEFSRPKVVAEDQEKVLLVNGTDKARQAVRSIIARLDKVANAEDNSKVFFLKYADAVDMAKLLSSGGGTSSDSNVQNAGDVVNDTGSGDGDHAQNDSGNNFGEQNQLLSNNSTESSSDYGSSLNNGSPIFKGASVQADKANNALVVHAPEEEMRQIESIINKLDIRRNQVLVEAIIVEIQDADGLNLGVSWFNSRGGGFGYNSDGSSDRTTKAANGFGENQPIASALKDSGGLVAGFYHGNWGSLFSALESNKHNNILATPSIVTLDNRQAEFNVGQDIPILTGSRTTNSDNIFNTVERRTVGFKFKIRSMIDQGNTVQLYISQEISSLTDASTANIDSKLGAVFNIRTVNNVVQVENGETVVIGGLLDKEQNNRVSKVPLLGDIPWIGGLFRYTSHNDTKRNLMLFIRPHIIRVQDRYNDLTADQYDSFKEEQRKDNPDLVKSLESRFSGRGASSRESIAYIQSNIAEFAREVAE